MYLFVKGHKALMTQVSQKTAIRQTDSVSVLEKSREPDGVIYAVSTLRSWSQVTIKVASRVMKKRS